MITTVRKVFYYENVIYLENLFDGEIVMINVSIRDDEDIIQDFISIITSFCAKIYGKRRSKRKTQQIIERLEKDDKKNDNQC